jgi:hypothetical protein
VFPAYARFASFFGCRHCLPINKGWTPPGLDLVFGSKGSLI